MTRDSNQLYSLSRRRMLAGLGAVGLASAGAGLGTSAYFSDEESFENNTLTAGELDLSVQANVYEYQGAANGGGQSFGGVQNGQAPTVAQQLADVKPGDYSWGAFCFSIVDNPGYIWAGGELAENDENGQTEPEMAVDSTTGAGNGELADAAEVTLFYADPSFDPGAQSRPSESSFSDVLFEGTLRETLAYLGTGVPLDADPSAVGRQAFTGTPEESFGEDVCLAFAWEVPTSVGNEIQGDSVEFDITFLAQQERHNDGSQVPFADAVVTSDPTGGVRETGSWLTAYINAGPTTAITVHLDGEVYGNGATEWPSNPNSYTMEVNIDVDNDGVDEAANDDDFRVNYGSAAAGSRSAAIANSSSGASGPGGAIRRNVGGTASGDAANRVDIAAEDVPGFTAYESPDQLTYVFILDWSQIAADGDAPTAQLGSAPDAIQVNEVFGGDGGEGVAAVPNSSNDGRGGIDNVTDPSGTLTL
ncbi:SipW-dependent-type signal peptide-containing protein [Halobellus ruber]|uniref:SipW-cognate class signal peptide n=1 Tax=Halobellus ruber TaxID=2761102 RepID=A0A7J9SMH5_9EURY|nr:SipW-dependent-type signal peptide-containing protein [Halobellus ruber]MBB6647623.1 hypothetical protein [Halobellus ruber]